MANMSSDSPGSSDPSLNHWYVMGSDPVTVQIKVRDCPASTLESMGSPKSVNSTPTVYMDRIRVNVVYAVLVGC